MTCCWDFSWKTLPHIIEWRKQQYLHNHKRHIYNYLFPPLYWSLFSFISPFLFSFVFFSLNSFPLNSFSIISFSLNSFSLIYFCLNSLSLISFSLNSFSLIFVSSLFFFLLALYFSFSPSLSLITIIACLFQYSSNIISLYLYLCCFFSFLLLSSKLSFDFLSICETKSPINKLWHVLNWGVTLAWVPAISLK